MPLHKLLGGCRDKVKAYASTYPNMGPPEDYAEHALACKRQGYRHYKIHPYYFWDPGDTGSRTPAALRISRPGHRGLPRRARGRGRRHGAEYDPWGTYHTYEEAYRVGRELERLNFYWYEHPMPEYRVCAPM